MLAHLLIISFLASVLVSVHQASSAVIGVKPGDNNDIEQSKLSSEITDANDVRNLKFLLTKLIIAGSKTTVKTENDKRNSAENPGTKEDILNDDTELVTGSRNEDETEVDDAFVNEEDEDEGGQTDLQRKKISKVFLDINGFGNNKGSVGADDEEGDEEVQISHKKKKKSKVFLDIDEFGHTKGSVGAADEEEDEEGPRVPKSFDKFDAEEGDEEEKETENSTEDEDLEVTD